MSEWNYDKKKKKTKWEKWKKMINKERKYKENGMEHKLM